MSGRTLTIEKGNAKLTQWVDPAIDVAIGASEIVFTRQVDTRRERALHGLYRALANNMVTGLTKGYEKRLQIVGVGFGAKLQGKVVDLNVGYATSRRIEIPAGVTVEIPDPTNILIKGADKHAVGQLAARIRLQRPPEPYKGKGIRYFDEVVKRKQGKTVGS
jgi:large subunit ribosomal protein L6